MPTKTNQARFSLVMSSHTDSFPHTLLIPLCHRNVRPILSVFDLLSGHLLFKLFVNSISAQSIFNQLGSIEA